jgi:hypothetical protein
VNEEVEQHSSEHPSKRKLSSHADVDIVLLAEPEHEIPEHGSSLVLVLTLAPLKKMYGQLHELPRAKQPFASQYASLFRLPEKKQS